MTDYLDDFEELEYRFDNDEQHVILMNLKAMGGMDVAELLTYLYDDGYIHHGAMVADEDNGSLIVRKD